ncbi:uncharacterized protein LOC126830168 [Patella vulgata]|uniref:uncharacterized protein LOC126830168 n=1 Tax=Patella vulgata TaxID=6465 RepID=UPI0024A804BC|nr:uncharacterized protein LOC126830168 [Patella vulgata]
MEADFDIIKLKTDFHSTSSNSESSINKNKPSRTKMKSDKKIKLYVCPECDVELPSHASLRRHMKIHSSDTSVHCTKCFEVFAQRSGLKRHECIMVRKTFSCNEIGCSRTFTGIRHLKQHQRSHVSDTSLKCSHCSEQFLKKSQLKHHIKKHSDVRNFQCAQCGKMFRFKSNLTSHMNSHNGIKPYNCEFCSKAFQSLSEQRIHHRIHSGDKPCMCEICGQCFISNSALNRHKRMHHMKQPRLTCKICKKQYSTKRFYEDHMKIHSGERDFVCEYPGCNKSFYHCRGLNSHIIVYHAREERNKFSCPTCGKQCLSPSKLEEHMVNHTGLKPFVCSEENCSKTFATKTGLQRHLFIHKGVKPFQCEECGHKFTFKSHYNHHKESHHFLQQYQCTKCDTTATKVTQLKKHCLKHHFGIQWKKNIFRSLDVRIVNEVNKCIKKLIKPAATSLITSSTSKMTNQANGFESTLEQQPVKTLPIDNATPVIEGLEKNENLLEEELHLTAVKNKNVHWLGKNKEKNKDLLQSLLSVNLERNDNLLEEHLNMEIERLKNKATQSEDVAFLETGIIGNIEKKDEEQLSHIYIIDKNPVQVPSLPVSNPVTMQSVKNQPLITKPVETQSLKNQTVMMNPLDNQSLKNQPFLTKPVETQSFKTKTTKVASEQLNSASLQVVKDQPVKCTITEPHKSNPVEVKLVMIAPVESQSSETGSVETKSSNSQSIVEKPAQFVEDLPVDTHNFKRKHLETQSSKTKYVLEHPVETKTIESQHIKVKSMELETQPAETKFEECQSIETESIITPHFEPKSVEVQFVEVSPHPPNPVEILSPSTLPPGTESIEVQKDCTTTVFMKEQVVEFVHEAEQLDLLEATEDYDVPFYTETIVTSDAIADTQSNPMDSKDLVMPISINNPEVGGKPLDLFLEEDDHSYTEIFCSPEMDEIRSLPESVAPHNVVHSNLFLSHRVTERIHINHPTKGTIKISKMRPIKTEEVGENTEVDETIVISVSGVFEGNEVDRDNEQDITKINIKNDDEFMSVLKKMNVPVHELDKLHLPYEKDSKSISGSLFCQDCGKFFKSEQTLKKHKKLHIERQQLTCLKCDRKFADKAALSLHKRTSHVVKDKKCSQCGKCFQYNNQLLEHMDAHLEGKRFMCASCGESFKTKLGLQGHKISHHKISVKESSRQIYVCEICGNLLRAKTAYEDHMNIHAENPIQYQCQFRECNKTFLTLKSYKAHGKCHQEKKRFACSVCSKSFMFKAKLDEHMTKHTGIKRFACTFPGCDTKLGTRTGLERHLILHSGVKKFFCKNCGKSFAFLGHLNAHVASHSGEKRHWCKVCGKGFTRTGGLNKHLRLKNGCSRSENADTIAIATQGLVELCAQ